MTRPRKTERNALIVKLRQEGKSFNLIADMFQLTRQTVHEIYHRETSGLSTGENLTSQG